MLAEPLNQLVIKVLDDRKAVNVVSIDVRGKTSITDYMIIATATSARHAKGLCDYVAEALKEQGGMPLGQEGSVGSDWVLLDLGDVVLHVMTGQAREYYQLEKLWSVPAAEASNQNA